ncbi:hypothetical protein AB3M75_16665 [Serratia ureilytica]|uniref:tail completion or Neck1 protein n=1 Tax=Aeromonas phage pAEv1818 TaxID=2908746 RepID=UPI000EF2666E|nr:hypothetical protein [Gibbsiella quercinecans]YP_010648486.1 tail completion or Neck1 protein [Aeromonas phage pAEv1818]KAB5494544.1 hypothetical protein F8564_19220 [Enterobacter sp. RJAL6]HCR3021380.1 hypothetical protein [Serratia marcescens]RLM12537.1 hypothetical protein BIY27_11275 [Gibbsiella quercinecans]UIS24933.1 tail component [Aeromonas phage pAEv1818]HCR3025866.1 hypothetical protein [Serratia marcescens]
MAENDAFMQAITAFVDKAKANQAQVVRATGIRILTQLVQMSPVGNPDLWEVNATAKAYNDAVAEHNDAQRNDPANLTPTGRLKKRARVSDSMDIKAPAGYTGGRFRGNWQVGLDAAPQGETGQVDKSGGKTLAAGTLVIERFRVGMQAVYFTNNVPYAYPLEFGHSSQAPGGMVRITAADFQRHFQAAVSEVKS